jgi:hypothetical protein
VATRAVVQAARMEAPYRELGLLTVRGFASPIDCLALLPQPVAA